MILVIPVYSCAFHNRRTQNPSKSLKIYHENTKRVDCREYLNEVLNEPGLPDFTTCAKSLDNQGIPGTSGKPGYSKNQENQTWTQCAKSLVNQDIPGKSGKHSYSKNQENQT